MWFRSTRRGGIQDATGRHAQSVQYLLSRGVPGSARSISISIVEGTPRERDATQSGELRTLLCSSSGRCSALAVSEADAAGGRFADGGWHQYALSISPNGDVELFVDGSYRAGCARCMAPYSPSIALALPTANASELEVLKELSATVLTAGEARFATK